MNTEECVTELLDKGWRGRWDYRLWSPKDVFCIDNGPGGTGPLTLWLSGTAMAAADSLPVLLGRTMPGSAGITVAAYFGLRNPGVASGPPDV
jgi:hypothetical protein